MRPADEPEWIELETVFFLHGRHLREHGGIEGIRDEGLLLSALNRPVAKWDYERPHPDLPSAVVCETFLILNGLSPTATEEEKYPIFLGLASGEIDEKTFAQWLRDHTAPMS